MNDFESTLEPIYLRPQDKLVPFRFTFPACTSQSANDGSLPYGTLITSAQVTAYDQEGSAITTMTSGGTTITSAAIVQKLTYPSTGTGQYSLQFVVNTTGGSTIEFEFDKVFAL